MTDQPKEKKKSKEKKRKRLSKGMRKYIRRQKAEARRLNLGQD